MRPVPSDQLPLARWRIFGTDDPELARQRVSERCTGHRLRLLHPDGRFDAQFNSRRFGDATLAAMTYGAEVVVESDEVRRFFAIMVPLAGSALLRLGNDLVHASPKAGAIVSTADRFSMRWSADCAVLVLRVEADAVEHQLIELVGQRIDRPLRFSPPLDLTRGAGLSIGSALTHIATELDLPDTVIDHPLLSQRFEDTVTTGLLLTREHNYSGLLSHARTPTSGLALGLDTALALLEAHPEQPWDVAGLAKHAGMSSRSLQRAFRTHLGRTFSHHLTQVRLRRVRRQLRTYSPDATTVAEIATRWGFRHNDYFVDMYVREFGETPVDTLHR